MFSWPWRKVADKPSEEKALVYSYVIFPGSEGIYQVKPATDRRYKDPYRLWVFAAIDLIANKAGDFEIRLWQGDKEIENPAEHPAYRFMETRNPYNFSQFLYIAIAQLELYGQSLWRYQVIDRQPHLINMPPTGVEVRVDDERQEVIGYKYALTGGGIYEVPAREVVRIYRPDPRQPLKPFATIEALLDANDVDALAHDFVRNAMYNGAYLPLIITSDGPLDSVFTNPEIQKDVLEQLKMFYRGPSGAARPIILPGGAKILEAKTMDLKAFAELLPDARDEILGVFRLPASKLGLVEDVNRANAEANNVTFLKECVLPRLALIEDALNTQLWPMLGREYANVQIEFVPPEWEDKSEKIAETSAMLEAGVITPNEVRTNMGLEPVPWGDTPLPYGRILAQQGFPPSLKSGTRAVQKRGYSRVGMLMGNRFLFNEMVLRHNSKWRSHWETTFRNAIARTKEFVGKYGLPTRETKTQFLDFILPDWREIVTATEAISYRLLVQGYEAARELAGRWMRGMNFESQTEAEAVLMAVRKDYADYPWATEFARRTGAYIWQGIENDLDEIIATAQTAEDLIGGISDLRLTRIDRTSLFTARTEATMSINMGEMDVFRDEGVITKEWRTVGDAQTRMTHLDAEAMGEIPLDEPFDVGGFPAQYPGDPNLPEGELLNCRCALLPGRITTLEV